MKKNLEKHENEFFFAYRSHMSKVEYDLKQMKNQIEEDEKQNKSNEKIVQLEKDLMFFKTESQNLSVKLREKTKENEILKENLMILKSEKAFLENRHIELSKNKVEKPTKIQEIPNKSPGIKKENIEKTVEITKIRKKIEVVDLIQKYQINNNSEEFYNDLDEIITKKLEETNFKMKKIAQNMQKLKKINTFLNFQLNKISQNQNELKEYLENCFNSVKQHIMNRKKFAQGPTNDGISFEDFRISDKLKLLSYLLSNESVFQLLISKIFEENNQTQTVIEKEKKSLKIFLNQDFQKNYVKKPFDMINSSNQTNDKRTRTPSEMNINSNSKSPITEKLKAILVKREDSVNVSTLTDRIDNNSFDARMNKNNAMKCLKKKGREKSLIL